MSRKRSFLTFAAKIQHFKKKFVGNRALAYGAIGSGKHCKD